jgi:SAM-dependent methyltransferase
MSHNTMHEEIAARRGNPSFVWRAGQVRRLDMIFQALALEGKRVLDIGCGVGMYTGAFAQHSEHVVGVEVEAERARAAYEQVPRIAQAVGEALPYVTNSFDVVFSHEVLEHVHEDRLCAAEMVRVTRPGGHIVIFVPNRLYFLETHGIYWRGVYHFGNKPLVNWLPNALRNRLAPHVRAYRGRDLKGLFTGLPIQVRVHTQIYPGYDNIVARRPRLGRLLQGITYTLERTPLRAMGLSHFLVLEVMG